MRGTKLLSLIISLFMLTTAVFAQGRVSGKVTDTDNFSLAGANIYIKTLNRGTSSNHNGEFFMTLPAGSYNLTVSYLGFQNQTVDLVVEDGKTTTVNVAMQAGVVLGEEVLVLGDRLKGQAKALNQQRAAQNITNVVASDQIGRFPDANIGDALKRIPAITVNYDQGEARFGNIRGTEPRLNSFMINGERIPSAEAEIRAVQLDLVPSDMIQTIEVNKAVTPEMDADAIGGSVNLVTRQAPNGLRISGTAGSGYNFLREKPQTLGTLILGNRFAEDKLGIVLSASYHDHKLASDNAEGDWTDDDGNFTVEEWQNRKYVIDRTRQSISAALDYKFDPFNTIYVRGMYNHRNDRENRYRVVYKIEDDEIERQTKAGINNDEVDNRRLEDQRTYTFGVEGEHILQSGVKIDWSGSYAKASEERPNERYLEWVAEDVPMELSLADPREPQVDAGNVPLTKYELSELTEEYQYTEEKDLNAKLNVEFPVFKNSKSEGSLKIGGRFKNKEKERDNNFFEYSPIDEDNFTFVDSDLENLSDSDFLAGDYLIGDFTSNEFLGSLDLDNPNLFEKEDKPDEYAADNFTATEKVYAGYIQYNHKLDEKWSFLVGARVEATNIDYEGNEFNEDTETITPTTGDDSYTNFLPGVHVKYDYNDNTIFRFAWTNTIARPNYYDLVPYRAIAEDDEEIEVGNPSLEPTTSMNFDFMVESYFKTVGLVSGGLFYKKIDDFIYIYSEDDYTDPQNGITYDEFFQPRNGAEATLFGFEAAFQRRLDFMPGILRNLNLYTNYTYTYSTADNPVLDEQVEGDEDIELPGTAPHTFNANLTYQDAKIVLGVSFNYSSAYIDPDELDLTPGLERYYDAVTYLDVNGSYAFTNQFRFFFEANNLLNQPLRFYAGEKDRTQQAEYYSWRLTAGIKFDL